MEWGRGKERDRVRGGRDTKMVSSNPEVHTRFSLICLMDTTLLRCPSSLNCGLISECYVVLVKR